MIVRNLRKAGLIALGALMGAALAIVGLTAQASSQLSAHAVVLQASSVANLHPVVPDAGIVPHKVPMYVEHAAVCKTDVHKGFTYVTVVNTATKKADFFVETPGTNTIKRHTLAIIGYITQGTLANIAYQVYTTPAKWSKKWGALCASSSAPTPVPTVTPSPLG